MKVDGKDYRTVWMENGVVYLINQSLLPHSFTIFRTRDYQKTAEAIKNMVVRGAPAIAATGAYGLAQAVLNSDSKDLEAVVLEAERTLKSTRPTAIELYHAIDYVKREVLRERDIEKAKRVAIESANRYADLSVESCRKIGEIGESLIECGSGILTHCNAGALACVDYDTWRHELAHAQHDSLNQIGAVFQKEWEKVAGDDYGKLSKVGLTEVHWNDDHGGQPKKGYIQPYGATDVWEDVATYTEFAVGGRKYDELSEEVGSFIEKDAMELIRKYTNHQSTTYDLRYGRKLYLLKKYQFINPLEWAEIKKELNLNENELRRYFEELQ